MSEWVSGRVKASGGITLVEVSRKSWNLLACGEDGKNGDDNDKCGVSKVCGDMDGCGVFCARDLPHRMFAVGIRIQRT